MGKLTDVTIRNAKAEAKAYKMTDGDGLILEVSPKGSKLWRYRYRFQGREQMLALGK
ncbi:MAG: Arm DNA-binding domain-containing protein [Rickettsiales bacterium]|nr:Arm DNA-binding domain-containing protein [Rickettsiales bacterium]